MGSLPQLSVIKGPSRTLNPYLLNQIFESIARGPFKDNVALIFEDHDKIRKRSYKEIDKITNQIAHTLLGLIRKNNTAQPNLDGDYLIAVNLHPSDHLIIILLAIWKAGAAYLPLDHAFPGQRIKHILSESRPILVIHDDDDDDDSSHYLDTPRISLDKLYVSSTSQSENPVRECERLRHTRDDLAIVLYTSGSTGIPKGVRLPHKAILNRLQWQFNNFPYSQTEEVCVFKTALTFVDSVAEIWGPLMNGLTLLIVPKYITKDPEKLIGLLERYRVERLVLVPTLLRSILMYLELQKPSILLHHLKLWVCSGETLAVSLVEEFFNYFTDQEGYRLCNFYGSTEVMGDVTFHICTNREQLKHQNKIPIGLPVDNTVIYLLDTDLRPVKAGETGELYVSGRNLAAGYVNNRDKDRFLNNQLAIDPVYTKLYRTGDFAKYEKGTLFYEGRIDSQIKIRGHRVDLHEIEKAVLSLDCIEKAVVLCYKPGEINQALLAFVTIKTPIDEVQIENLLKMRLTSYMVPQVVILDNIPLLVNGKIDRQTLLKSYENNNDNICTESGIIDYGGVAIEQIPAAKVLFETVASVLNRNARSTISIEANFYEIGGNSLNSIYTVTKLAEQGYKISKFHTFFFSSIRKTLIINSEKILGITDFITAADLGEVLDRMTTETAVAVNEKPQFTAELLRNEHKLIVLDMITTSFYQKAELEQLILSDISEEDYVRLIDAIWSPLLEKNLSFIAKTSDGRIVGVALNFDARDEPEVNITSGLTVIFEFLEHIEGPVRDTQLPEGKGKILHSFMMGTHSSLTPKENVAVMQFLEDEVLKLATERGFAGIFTTNTSPLTQQLGTDVYKYQTLLDYQLNQYVASDNTRPFEMAPDDQRVLVQWKPVQRD